MNRTKIKLVAASIIALISELLAPVFISQVALASPAQFSQLYVRPDRHKALTATGVLICATPDAATTAVTEDTVIVTFPTVGVGTDFVVNSTAANWIVDSTNLPTGTTFWPGMTSGTTAASSVAGHTVTFPSGNLAAATQYCFHITGTSTLTNSSATIAANILGATVIAEDSAGPTISNQTNWSTAVITDDTITVTAVVPPNFSLTLSTNADPFITNLDPGSVVATTGVAVSISTNAVGGFITWAKDSQQGLYSTTANYTIPSGLMNVGNTANTITLGDPAFVLIPGREGYAMDVDITTAPSGGCSLAIDAAYDNATADGGGMLGANFLPIAACTRPGAPPGTSDGHVMTLIERATIRGGTPAGSDYADIITVVGAGNF